MSWIVDLGSGSASNITAQSMLYANGVPDVVGNFDPSAGNVQWQDGARPATTSEMRISE